MPSPSRPAPRIFYNKSRQLTLICFTELDLQTSCPSPKGDNFQFPNSRELADPIPGNSEIENDRESREPGNECPSLNINDISLTYHAPALWNSQPKDLRYLLSQTSSRPTSLSLTTNDHLLALSASQFHSKLKTHLFLQSFPPKSARTFT